MTIHFAPAPGLFRRSLTAVTLIAACAAGSVRAEGVTFEGMQIESITPSGTGGSGDAYVRFFEPWYSKTLPGNPTVIVRNMGGGGTLTGSNYFEENAKPDGSSYFLVPTSGMLTYLLRPDEPNIRFDPTGWKSFIASPMGRVAFVHPKSGIKSVEDLLSYDGELVMGLAAPTGSDMPTMLAFDLLGVRIKAIIGLDGGEQSLAYQRGELTVNNDTTAAYMSSGAQMEQDGIAVPMFTFGVEDDSGKIVRDPNFPDLPTWNEVYEMKHGKAPEGPGYDAWRALFGIVVMGSKALVLPAGTPQEVVDAYVKASEEMIADPQFAEEAAVRIGSYPQSTGAAAQRIQDSKVNLDDDARAYIRSWLKDKLGVGS